MIDWIARSLHTLWSASLPTVTAVMDDADAVWEPFLIDDDRLDAGSPLPHAIEGAA
jgi:hypothetical protein